MRNLSKFYYQDYYNKVDFSFLLDDNVQTTQEQINEIKSRNRELCGPNVLKVIDNPAAPQDHRFKLQVCYPGLVTGVGINHEAKLEGEFKLGMHFDWTWGMPVIYGSSVKGVLRSWFAEFYKNEYEGDDYLISKLIDDIFEGGKKSIYQRDIFFDAVIVNANNQHKILAPDSITPHGENPLKNPIPITFMKIAPGCKIEFRFRLCDTEIDGVKFGAKDKLELFKKILTTVGIGAKTNVGYGQLSVIKEK